VLSYGIPEFRLPKEIVQAEIAQLENPARIAPMAEELGLVIPTERRQLLVRGVGRDDGIVDPDYTTVQTADATEPSS